MKRSLLRGAVSAIAMIGSAQAADLGGGMKETEAPIWNWAGFYVGANGGYIWDQGGETINALEAFGGCDGSSCAWQGGWENRAQHDLDGGFGGGQIGFNWQRYQLVYGFEGDVQGSSLSDSVTAFPDPYGLGYGHSSVDLDWFATIRGRLGLIPWQNILVYITGGVAFGGVDANMNQSFVPGSGYPSAYASQSHSDTYTGYVLGAGVEYGWSPAWSVKFEYQFMDLGSVRLAQTEVSGPNSCGCITGVSPEMESKLSFNTVRVGINYHFLPEYVPLK